VGEEPLLSEPRPESVAAYRDVAMYLCGTWVWRGTICDRDRPCGTILWATPALACKNLDQAEDAIRGRYRQHDPR
jgi:hypothetical protein